MLQVLDHCLVPSFDLIFTELLLKPFAFTIANVSWHPSGVDIIMCKKATYFPFCSLVKAWQIFGKCMWWMWVSVGLCGGSLFVLEALYECGYVATTSCSLFWHRSAQVSDWRCIFRLITVHSSVSALNPEIPGIVLVYVWGCRNKHTHTPL
jgi:hypothetical protein